MPTFLALWLILVAVAILTVRTARKKQLADSHVKAEACACEVINKMCKEALSGKREDMAIVRNGDGTLTMYCGIKPPEGSEIIKVDADEIKTIHENN